MEVEGQLQRRRSAAAVKSGEDEESEDEGEVDLGGSSLGICLSGGPMRGNRIIIMRYEESHMWQGESPVCALLADGLRLA